MITKYRIELWNPIKKKYEIWWKSNSFKFAEKMFDKPYVSDSTRRLIKTTEEILYKEKKK